MAKLGDVALGECRLLVDCCALGWARVVMEAPTRVELVNNGFADRCLTTWLRRLISFNDSAE